MVTSIEASDYFKDKEAELSLRYDFNNDGTVDIADYRLACLYIQDDNENTNIEFSQEHLDQVFASYIDEENYDENIDETTSLSELNEKAEAMLEDIRQGATSPQNAQTLNELQTIGATLSKYIKEGSELEKFLSQQIETLRAEIEDLKTQVDIYEHEYDTQAKTVDEESSKLNKKINSALADSQSLTTEFQKKSTQIIEECIEAYKNGEYPNEQLYNVIENKLNLEGGLNTSALDKDLKDCTVRGEEIKSLCKSIDKIVGNLRNAHQKYNDKNSLLNRTISNRNSVASWINTSSARYQEGYEVRQNMRKEIIDKYHVEGNGDVSSSNPQVQKLAEFLNNKELDNMPYADAWNILQNTFDDCGIKYDAEKGVMSIPKGHDASSTNIYNALVQSMKDNYGINAERYDDGYQDPEEPGNINIQRNDPMTFSKGNIKYEFIQDRDGNGIFDDESEFLGAEKGWEEMIAYDEDSDGIISGDELKKLQVVAVNQTNGQYTFTNAHSAGVESINLDTYKEINETQITGDLLAGTFEVNLGDKIVQGTHSYDTERNIENKYAILFGAKITDLSDTYEENPFLKDFAETVNTKNMINSTTTDIALAENSISATVKRAEKKVENKISDASLEAKTTNNQTEKTQTNGLTMAQNTNTQKKKLI